MYISNKNSPDNRLLMISSKDFLRDRILNQDGSDYATDDDLLSIGITSRNIKIGEEITLRNPFDIINIYTDDITITKGDYITPSSEGKAKKFTGSGCVIAIAISDYKNHYIDCFLFQPTNMDTTSLLGEVNTSSNAGVTGIGVVLPKSGVDLPFKSITSGSSDTITLTDNIGNNSIDVDVKEENLKSDIYVKDTYSNGFVNIDDVSVSFSDLLLELTISSSSGSFEYYSNGIKYTKTGNQTINITDVEGLHYIYYNGDTLQTSTSYNNDIIKKYAFVSVVYWDFTNKKHIYLGHEYKHSFKMSSDTHLYLHNTRGFSLASGGGLGNIIVDADGSLNAHVEFSNESSMAYDEDAFFNFSARLSTSIIPLYYRTGLDSNNIWRVKDTNSLPLMTAGTGRASYNQLSGGSWLQTEIVNNNYLLTHVFIQNDVNRPFACIQGQSEYTLLDSARNGAFVEVNNIILNGLPDLEFKFIGTIIYQTSNSYTNSVKSRIRSTADGKSYVDLRGETITRSGTSITIYNHDQLGNIQKAQLGVTDGHIDDQLQTIAGSKTFSNPITLNNYIDIKEITTPSNPTNEYGRIYTRDDTGVTNLYFRDNVGNNHLISHTIKELFYPVQVPDRNYGNYAVIERNNTQDLYMTFKVPSDYVSMLSFDLVYITKDPTAVGSGKDIDFYAEYGGSNELYNTHTGSDTTSTYTIVAVNTIGSITLPNILVNISANDNIGLYTVFTLLGGKIEILGFNMKYKTI